MLIKTAVVNNKCPGDSVSSWNAVLAVNMVKLLPCGNL